MYKENEKLRLLGNIGKEGDKGFVPKGTEVTFVKAIDSGLQSFVVVQLEDRIFTIKEISVEPLETNALAVLKKFNNELMDKNPELRKYHHNVIMRLFYRIRDFFKKLLTKNTPEIKVEEDLSDLKKLINDGGEVE
jgi:hypothetical protein